MNHRQSIIREILLVRESLERHPRAGFVCPLPGDVFLEQKSGKAFRVVQGDWRELPVEQIPIPHLLEALRKALEWRRNLTRTRIDRLVRNLDAISQAIESCSLDSLDNLTKILDDMAANRRRD